MDPLDDCGCCEGADKLQPARANPAGSPAIVYRAGTHASFKAALLAQLSSTAHPALASLRTRSDDDFSIAACDATAVLLDVLTFYQERYANELYLRTAVERRSLLELARLIGYQLAPGVAASVHLAFKLQESPGVPALAAEPVTIPVGTRVQSVPGPDEEPQTFETVEEITARVEWNAVPVQSTQPQMLGTGTKQVFIAGVASQVQVGDVILLVGDERAGSPPVTTAWSARVVRDVETNAEAGYTRLAWPDALGAAAAQVGVKVYVFRLHTALFGHNAADPRVMRIPNNDFGLTTGSNSTLEWLNYKIVSNEIDLDGAYPKVVAKSWFLLAGGSGATQDVPELPGSSELFLATTVTHRARAAFGLSGKITRLAPDTTAPITNYENRLKETLVLAQSEELALVQRPLPYPLFGTTLALAIRSEELAPKQMIAVSGKRQRLSVEMDDVLQFKPDDGSADVDLDPGDSFT